jgi:hypothetical protein
MPVISKTALEKSKFRLSRRSGRVFGKGGAGISGFLDKSGTWREDWDRGMREFFLSCTE